MFVYKVIYLYLHMYDVPPSPHMYDVPLPDMFYSNVCLQIVLENGCTEMS